MRILKMTGLGCFILTIFTCQYTDKVWDYRYKEHHLKMEKKVLALQVKVMELQAIADALPRFQKELNKRCSNVKSITMPKVAPFDEEKLKDVSLPSFYLEVPARLRREKLTMKYLNLQEKLIRLNYVVKMVEGFRQLSRVCSQNNNTK